MSQARVTDFFSQRKKGLAGPVKPAKQRGTGTYAANTRSRSAKNKELCSSSVHQEFIRVIDEAVGLHDGDSSVSHAAKNQPSSPRTPKRTSADAEFDLGTAVFSATAEHSTAKKRRQQAAEGRETATAVQPEKTTRRTARKKLILPQDEAQVTLQAGPLIRFLGPLKNFKLGPHPVSFHHHGFFLFVNYTRVLSIFLLSF